MLKNKIFTPFFRLHIVFSKRATEIEIKESLLVHRQEGVSHVKKNSFTPACALHMAQSATFVYAKSHFASEKRYFCQTKEPLLLLKEKEPISYHNDVLLQRQRAHAFIIVSVRCFAVLY